MIPHKVGAIQIDYYRRIPPLLYTTIENMEEGILFGYNVVSSGRS